MQEIIKTAWDNGINLIDTAEAYAKGQCEIEVYVFALKDWLLRVIESAFVYSGRVIKELNFRRSDLIVTTKLYWGTYRFGPNNMGLSRKQ